MSQEVYRESRDEDSSESWNKGRDFPMTEAERAASWQRGIEYRNTSPDSRELLGTTNLTITRESDKFYEGKGTSRVFTIRGVTEDGREISVTLETAPAMGTPIKYWNYKDIGEHRELVPESIRTPHQSTADNYTGSIDGESVSAEEARELWKKYSRTAAVATVDQELADFVDDESLKSMWREQFSTQDKASLEEMVQHIKELMKIPEGEQGHMNPEVRRKNEIKLEILDEALQKLLRAA